MKKLILFLLFFPILLFPQIEWQENGIPIRKGDYIEWQKASVAFDNEMIVAWTDCRRSDRDVWLQKYDIQGNPLWSEDILVCGEIDRQEDIVIIKADENSVIIAWIDFRNEYEGDIYAQKVTLEGELIWDNNGLQVCTENDIQRSLELVSDESSGAYIIWLDYRGVGGSAIYGTHILAGGTIGVGWDLNGSPIVTDLNSQNQLTFCEDGEGGAILVWHDTRNVYDENLYMQRISQSGNILWTENGVLVTNAPDTQEKPKLKPAGNGEFFITWRDKRSDPEGDIYAQKINLDGDIMWANDKEIYGGNGIQRNPLLTYTLDNAAVITWEDGRDDPSYKDIYIQKIDSNGNLIWNYEGVPIVIAEYDQLNISMIADENNGCWITWEDNRLLNHPFHAIYLQHIDSNGSALLQNNGIIVCDEQYDLDLPMLKHLNNSVCISWQDSRTQSESIYTQFFDMQGNFLLPSNGICLKSGLSGDALNHHFLTNVDNPVILWEDTRNNNLQIYMQILNPDGSTAFDKNGIPITNNTECYQENMDVVFNSNNGLTSVVWEEIRENTKKIYTQAIDQNGSFTWSDDLGIQVSANLSPENQEYPQISNIINGTNIEYFIGWSDPPDWINGFDIYAQKLSEDGTILWTDDVLICDSIGDNILYEIIQNYFIWVSIQWPNHNLYVKSINSDGSTMNGWPEEGLLICGEPGIESYPKGFLTNQDLLVIWEDYRNNNRDIYGQLITSEGNTLWQDSGTCLATGDFDDLNFSIDFNDEYFYMSWESDNGSNFEIKTQKYDYLGSPVWQNDLVLGVANSDKDDPDIKCVEDGLIVTWSEQMDYVNKAIKAQMINESGEILWSEDGLFVCDYIRHRNKPILSFNGNDHIYCTWEDERSSYGFSLYDIYAQKINISELFADDHSIPSYTCSLCNYPNPFNPTTTISFSIQELSKINLSIYNIKGQKVKTLVNNELTSGSHSIIWNGKNESGETVSSGLFFYKLNVNGKAEEVKKCLLLK